MGNEEEPKLLMAEPLLDYTKVSELMKREAAIRDRLISGFENLDFLWAAEDQLAWMLRNRDLLLDALSPDPSNIRQQIVTMRADVLFHFGNYLASVSAGRDFLYNNGKATFSPGLLRDVHRRADHMKKSSPYRIMLALRNRQQHAPPVIDSFNVEQRTKWHAEGEGLVLCPLLTDRTLAAVEEMLPTSDAGVAAHMARIKDAHATKKDWLTPLLHEHWAKVEGAFDECRTAVRTAHADEVMEYERLRAELEAVEGELKAMDLIAFP
ncbi:MAG: hypothetical protein ACE366_24670 [Bradymonadia bacterium]